MTNAVAVVGETIPPDARDALGKLVRQVFVLPADPHLPTPVAAHPDMLLFSLGGSFVTYRSYYHRARDILDPLCACTGRTLRLTDHPYGNVYPQDVGLNALPIAVSENERYLFARPASLAPEVVTLANAAGYQLIPVKQGYAGCSGLAVAGTLLTGDPSLRQAAASVGIPTLTVEDRAIRLPGYDHGFIGGSGGVWGRTVVLCGVPEEKLLQAIQHCPAVDRVLCLGEGPWFDCGGIRLFSTNNESY